MFRKNAEISFKNWPLVLIFRNTFVFRRVNLCKLVLNKIWWQDMNCRSQQAKCVALYILVKNESLRL